VGGVPFSIAQDVNGNNMWAGIVAGPPFPTSLDIPVNATLFLIGAGLAGLAGTTWRRHRRK
jgi:hypothetical protein